MNEIRQLHEEAMDMAEKAMLAKLNGYIDIYIQLARGACEKESEAARGIPIGIEPTRSILYRSAASLAMNAEEFGKANELIKEGLKGANAGVIEDELRELALQNQLALANKIMREMRVWWDRVYPADIFPIMSDDVERDEGPKFVSCIRQMLNEWEDIKIERIGSSRKNKLEQDDENDV